MAANQSIKSYHVSLVEHRAKSNECESEVKLGRFMGARWAVVWPCVMCVMASVVKLSK